MKKLFLFLLFLGIKYSFANINKDSIPFIYSNDGHLIIEATIEGVKGKFIFDTGAGLNVVFKDFSERLTKNRTNNFFVGHRSTGEPLKVQLYKCANLKIGRNDFKDQEYAFIDLQFGDIDGLISLQPFRNLPFTIDYSTKHIVFEKMSIRENKLNSIDIQLMDYAERALDIFTKIVLNDKVSIQVMLDSGAGTGSFWFNSDFIDLVGLTKENMKSSPIKSEFDSTKKNNFYFGKIASIKSDNLLAKTENRNVTFVDGLIYEGKTSLEWIGNRITIDLAKRKIYIQK